MGSFFHTLCTMFWGVWQSFLLHWWNPQHPIYSSSVSSEFQPKNLVLHRPASHVYILSHAPHFSSIATMRWSVLPCLLVSASVYGQSGRKETLDFTNLLWYRHSIVAPKKFLTLPLGQVRPAGWLLDQVLFFLLGDHPVSWPWSSYKFRQTALQATNTSSTTGNTLLLTPI